MLQNLKIPVNPEIIGINDNPKFDDLFKPNICIGFKRKGAKIFTYEEKGKKRKIYEINKKNIQQKNIKDLINKEDEPYNKFYYMLLKNK